MATVEDSLLTVPRARNNFYTQTVFINCHLAVFKMFVQLSMAEFIEHQKSWSVEALDLATTGTLHEPTEDICHHITCLTTPSGNIIPINMDGVVALAAKFGLEVTAAKAKYCEASTVSVVAAAPTNAISTAKSIIPAKAFHLFPYLPGEIRTKIWVNSVEGRCITAAEICKLVPDEDPEFRGRKYITQFEIIGAVPDIMLASREAMLETLTLGIYKPIRFEGTTKRVFYCPDEDTFTLRSDVWEWGSGQPEMLLCQGLKDPLDIGKVTVLKIDCRTYEFLQKWSLDNISTMHGLKELQLSGKFPYLANSLSEPRFFLYMDFQRAENEREFIPYYETEDGTVKSRVEAFQAIFYHIPEHEKHRLMMLFQSFNRACRFNQFPTCVSLFFDYFPIVPVQNDGSWLQ
jgi:hypothetical protein